MLERYAIVMAGGSGSRLWPLSRELRPKQFIEVENGKSMLRETLDRLSTVVPPEKCFVITVRDLHDITQKTLEGVIPEANILLEPYRKNTAACVAFGALTVWERYGPGILGFFPADGYVKNKDEYRDALKLAYAAAEDTGELVIVGIRPTYPATGYGYIRVDGELAAPVDKVGRFVEKPKAEAAEEMLASRRFLWNSGILVGSAETVIENIERFLPEHYDVISKAVRYAEGREAEMPKEAYRTLPGVSFDTGVLEKSGAISVVKGYFDWDDIGNLDALAKTFPEDADGNRVRGRHIGIDTAGSVIYSEELPVATIGLDNMIVAIVEDTALICPRDRVQEVKALVERLKNSGYGFLT